MVCSSAASSQFNPPTAAIHNPLVPPFISVTVCRQKYLKKVSVPFIADSRPVQRAFFRASTCQPLPFNAPHPSNSSPDVLTSFTIRIPSTSLFENEEKKH
jgi:hypothetical protein